MLRFRNKFPVGLFLAFVVFTTLPRTLFHHCEEGLYSVGSHEANGMVHADTHCPICEAPIPVCDGMSDLTFHVHMVALDAFFDEAIGELPSAEKVFPRQRGPPALG